MKRLKFSLESHAYQVEEYYLMLIYWDHIRTMFWSHKGHIRAMFWPFLLYIYIYLFDLLQIFTEKPHRINKTVPC